MFKIPNLPNLTDYRTKQVFKIYPDGIKLKRYSPLIPAGVQNTLNDLKDEFGEVIGDVELGNDGFLEIMYSTSNIRLIKIKKYPRSDKIEGFELGKS